ncbi:MAG: AMP-binding protein, partial [Candidatus Hydrothermae bacterium]|nr:AMP-binding protein [Candidatus Hydrothermae bacterium]
TEDGWFLTGDLGYIDEEGFLYLTGRKKSVIVTRGGKNIYPEEVESVLLQSPYIEEVLVLKGINPTSGDEEIQAIVYPNYEKVDSYFAEKGKSNPSEDDVLALISQEVTRLSRRLAPYKRPRRITLREEEFPKTTTKKIKRFLFEKPFKEIGEK